MQRRDRDRKPVVEASFSSPSLESTHEAETPSPVFSARFQRSQPRQGWAVEDLEMERPKLRGVRSITVRAQGGSGSVHVIFPARKGFRRMLNA